jgi:predicted nucleic acid-binding protein
MCHEFALARRFGCALVTLDNEQGERGSQPPNLDVEAAF